jgi:hypothetical protein
MNSNERLLKMISDAGYTCMLDGEEIVIAVLYRVQNGHIPIGTVALDGKHYTLLKHIPCTLDAALTFLGFTEES